jgi:hypothetical protein
LVQLGRIQAIRPVFGTTHGSYTDDEWMINELAAAGIVPQAAKWVGTIQQDRAVAIERAYIRSFFDLWLKYTDDHLLSGRQPNIRTSSSIDPAPLVLGRSSIARRTGFHFGVQI